MVARQIVSAELHGGDLPQGKLRALQVLGVGALQRRVINPDGVDRKKLRRRQGRPESGPAGHAEGVLEENFSSVSGEDGKRVSEQVMNANWAVVSGALPIGPFLA